MSLNARQSDAYREFMNKERAIAAKFRAEWGFRQHLRQRGWDPNSFDPLTGRCTRALPPVSERSRPYHSLIPVSPYSAPMYDETLRYEMPAAGQGGTPKVPLRYNVQPASHVSLAPAVPSSQPDAPLTEPVPPPSGKPKPISRGVARDSSRPRTARARPVRRPEAKAAAPAAQAVLTRVPRRVTSSSSAPILYPPSQFGLFGSGGTRHRPRQPPEYHPYPQQPQAQYRPRSAFVRRGRVGRRENRGRVSACRRMCEITRWKEALLLSKTRI